MSQNRTLLASYINGVKTPRNFCLNPNAQFNKANITDTNNIVTRDTSTVLDGVASYRIDANTIGHFAAFLATPFSKGVQGQNCEASFDYRGDASLYRAYVQMDSTVASAQQTLLNVTSGTQTVILNFPCGVSDVAVPSLVIESLSASAAAFNMGNIYIGKATNIGDSAQATLIGTMKMAPAANCDLVTSVGSGSWTVVAQDADCATPTVTGRVSVAASNPKRPAIQLSNLPAGDYIIRARGGFGVSSGANGCAFRFSDGTNTTSPVVLFSAGTGNLFPEISGIFSYTSPGTRNIEMQFAGDGATMNCRWYASQQTGLEIEVTRLPPASEQVFRVGAPGIGYTSYTPSFTGLGSPSSIDMSYQCVAPDLIRIYGRFTTGTPSAVGAAISLPTGFTTRTFTSGNRAAGRWWRNTAGANANKSGSLIQISGGTVLNFGFDEYTPAASPFTGINGDVIFGAGEIASIDAFVPITDSSPCPRASMPLLKNAETNEGSGIAINYDAYITQNAGVSTCTVVQQGGANWISSCTYGSSVSTLNLISGKFLNANNMYCTLGPIRGARPNIRFSSKPTISSIVLSITDEANTPLSDGGVFVSCREYR